MRRLQATLARWRHRLLRRLSASYRDHLSICSDREHWRVECIKVGNALSAEHLRTTELRAEVDKLQKHIDLLKTSHEAALLQLSAEPALRQSADARADRYHGELLDVLKASANWSTKSLNRRSMYPEVETPDPVPEDKPVLEAIRPKPFARQVGRQVTDATLRQVLEDIRTGLAQEETIGQVGPEFTSAG